MFHELESTAAGTYSRNRAFIRLTKEYAYWRAGWSGRPEDFAVFLHEYAHYLHNFSTGAGITEFLYELETVQLFLMTVGRDGTSQGIASLSPRWQEHYRLLQHLRGFLRGDFHLPLIARQLHRRSPHIQYVEHELREETFHFPEQPPTVVGGVTLTLEMSSQSSEATRHAVKFGSSMVMEGAAFELECLHLDGQGIDTQPHVSRVPPVPYTVARRVLEGITGLEWSHAQCIKACLLALNGTDAGSALIDIAQRVRAESAPLDDVLASMGAIAHAAFEDGLIRQLYEAVSVKLRALAERPLLAVAIKQFERDIRAYVSARQADPFFELRLAKVTPGSPALHAIFSMFPPCMVQVDDPLSAHPAPLEYIWGQASNPALVDSIAGYQTMMDFALAHASTGFGPTSMLKPRKCPFSPSCSLPTRVTTPEICEQTPWRAFDSESPALCWYGAGVGVSRGAVGVGSVANKDR